MAPALSVQWDGDRLTASWPTNASEFRLQQSARVTGPWTAVPGAAQIAGGHYEFFLEPEGRQRFFRLARTQPFSLPEAFVSVRNAAGMPVAMAWVGDDGLSDSGGVYSGSPQVSTSGWFTVQAIGHATGLGRSLAGLGSTAISEVWLTPLADIARLNSAREVRLSAGDPDNPTLRATIPANAFASFPLDIGLAEIALPDVGPLSAPLPGTTNLALLRAFALQAFDATWQPVGLANGAACTVELGLTEGQPQQLLLARFDPEAGVWVALPGACQHSEEDAFTCRLTELSAVHGLFASPPGSAALAAAARPMAARSSPEDDYKNARRNFQERLRQLEEQATRAEPIDPANDPALRDALNEMAAAASNYAAAHPDESGKLMLVSVASIALWLGREDLGASLLDAAKAIAERIARELLNTGDCGRVSEMLHAMQQLMLLGGDPGLTAALEEKIKLLLRDCDLWVGTIRYSYKIGSQHPAPQLANYTLAHGGGHWVEEHTVRMATHARTLVLSGESTVQLNFPRVLYEDQGRECEFSIAFYGEPQNHTVDLQFGGTYDGFTFNVGNVAPASYSRPASITQHHIAIAKDDDECVPVPGYPLTLPFPNFYSALAHGFLNSPPITIQEMVEAGSHSGSGEGETIRGSEPITNHYPAPNFGRYPFTGGVVYWSFIRVRAIIPLEQ